MVASTTVNTVHLAFEKYRVSRGRSWKRRARGAAALGHFSRRLRCARSLAVPRHIRARRWPELGRARFLAGRARSSEQPARHFAALRAAPAVGARFCALALGRARGHAFANKQEPYGRFLKYSPVDLRWTTF